MDVSKLKTLIDSYAVAVRAGVITPQSQDEAFIRQNMDLPEMSDEVKSDWQKRDNIRAPITIAKIEDETTTDQNDDQ